MPRARQAPRISTRSTPRDSEASTICESWSEKRRKSSTARCRNINAGRLCRRQRQYQELGFRHAMLNQLRQGVTMSDQLDQLCINTIRFLSVDAVQKAKS